MSSIMPPVALRSGSNCQRSLSPYIFLQYWTRCKSPTFLSKLMLTYGFCGWMKWMATLPSTEPSANPTVWLFFLGSRKILTQRFCEEQDHICMHETSHHSSWFFTKNTDIKLTDSHNLQKFTNITRKATRKILELDFVSSSTMHPARPRSACWILRLKMSAHHRQWVWLSFSSMINLTLY